MTENRDLAERLLVAMAPLAEGTPAELARLAVEYADALLARLAPAPVVPVARHEWVPKVGDRVRVTRDYANHANVKAGDEYVVTSLGTADYPETEAWGCGEGGVQYVRVCNLEPCAPPAPVVDAPRAPFRNIWQHDETGRVVELPLGAGAPGPRYSLVATTNAGIGASPVDAAKEGTDGTDAPRAPYVPKVGDVVYVDGGTSAVVYTGYDASKIQFPHRGVWVHSKIADGWTDGSEFSFVRKASDVDRAIAGLDAAPASVPTPAIDPRRTVGAVVRGGKDGPLWVVVVGGVGSNRLRLLGMDAAMDPSGYTEESDEFVRWMTPAECARHKIPYVDRTAPASKPVDREGLAKALRDAYHTETLGGACGGWDSLDEVHKRGYLAEADTAIAYLRGAS